MPDTKPSLLACPFCGGDPYYTETVNGSNIVIVGCSPCGVYMEAMKCWYPGAADRDYYLTKDVVAAWNTRAVMAVRSDTDIPMIHAQLAELQEKVVAFLKQQESPTDSTKAAMRSAVETWFSGAVADLCDTTKIGAVQPWEAVQAGSEAAKVDLAGELSRAMNGLRYRQWLQQAMLDAVDEICGGPK